MCWVLTCQQLRKGKQDNVFLCESTVCRVPERYDDELYEYPKGKKNILEGGLPLKEVQLEK